jgi:hypothetical protein
MGKDNDRVPDFKVHITYIPEDEKEADPSDGKAPSVKWLLDSASKTIDNPTVQVQPIQGGYYGGKNQVVPEPKLPTRGENSRRTFLFGSTSLTRNR